LAPPTGFSPCHPRPLSSPLPSSLFFTAPPPTATYTLSLHDALPICFFRCPDCGGEHPIYGASTIDALGAELNLPVLAKLPLDSRSEEHTSELQSRFDLVCRLLLEKKKKN